MDYQIKRLRKHKDDRGSLVVFLTQDELKYQSKKFGQIYFITFQQKDVVRGNHYHVRWREWFSIVKGSVRLKMKDVNSGNVKTVVLDSQDHYHKRVEVGPYIAHAFISLSDEASVIGYAYPTWSQEDTYPYKVI